jgi:thiamine biosynthesis lipoprotein
VASIHVHDLVDPEVVHAAVDAVIAELERLEAEFSTFRHDSLVSRINTGQLHPLEAGDELTEVLDACAWLEHDSGGAFCAWRLDGTLDPAGFVKGWAARRTARALDDAGLEHWYVAVGGDLQTRGTAGDGRPWCVAIADPLRPGEVVATLDVVDLAVATSGTAERGRHLWDARTGGRTGGALASMTVVGPDLTWADAFATAAFVMGLDGLAWVERHAGYRGLAVTVAGELVVSDGLRDAAS